MTAKKGKRRFRAFLSEEPGPSREELASILDPQEIERQAIEILRRDTLKEEAGDSDDEPD